jgi:hypothetical protein
MAIVTADEAARIIAQDQRQLNTRRLPPTLLMITKLMKDQSIFACNVGPWGHICDRPSLHLAIPPYDPKNDPQKLGYARSEPFPAIHRFAKIVDEHEMGWCEDDGRVVLKDLIGIGYGLPMQQSLVRFGVFVPEATDPTPAELAAARANLDRYLDELIAEARDAYDAGPEARKAVITPESRHIQAARLKGINEPWVHHQASQSSKQCEMCGRFNPTGVAKCQCGTILDFALFQKIQKQQEEMLDAATKPTKK